MIQVQNVTKRYGTHTAVSELSFQVEKGQIYGFLGPNGAGKSTTMNIVTGCLAATEGTVKIAGYDIVDQPLEAKRAIGYLPEIPPLYTDMSPAEYLDFVAEAKGIKKKPERKAEVERVMQLTSITDVQNRQIRQLSKGYRQRVGLAMALLGDPEVIILDEPTVGLDPKQIIEIRELIRSLGGKHTVILSSHILSEVSAICDHVLIIAHGKLVASGAPAELAAQMTGKSTLSLLVKGGEETVREALLSIPGVDGEQISLSPAAENGQIEAAVLCPDGRDIREEAFAALAENRCIVLKMDQSAHTLEDVFLQLTGADPAEEAAEPEVKEENADAGDL